MKFFAIGLWTIAAIATGYTLFYITFQVEALEVKLTRLNSEILTEQESVHVLKAEWSYLNRPDRIEKLSARLLPALQSLSTEQISVIDSIPERSPEQDPSAVGVASAATNIEVIPVKMGGAQ